jgi:hypothetical protein
MSSKYEDIVPGYKCTVNNARDLYFEADVRFLIGKPCVVVKRCKSGLIQVHVEGYPKRVESVPPYNISPRQDTNE